jgi:hypothetical protein
MTALRGVVAALLLLLVAQGAARAESFDAADVTPVSGLEALQPLNAADLGRQRGGRQPMALPMPRTTGGPVRFWDEIVRPIAPPSAASQGTISSTSRGAR